MEENKKALQSNNEKLEVKASELERLKNKNLKDYLNKEYPHLFREGKLGFAELKKEIGSDEYNEDIEENFSFGLSWAGQDRARAILNDEVENTLVYDADKSLNANSTENLLIEGDNLEALKLLKNGYYNAIKMIYIDPPYNTGNDFVYSDKFSTRKDEYLKQTKQVDKQGNNLTSNPKTNGRFHSNWLSMMYPRLRLAKDLLTEDGVIFISIDDNEQANLKLLCNQIFGEENFVSSISRKTKLTSDKGNYFSPSHEYLLCYAKDINSLPSFNDNDKQKSKEYIKLFNKEDELGKYNEVSLYMPSLDKRPNQRYFIVCPDGTKVITPSENKMFRWTEKTLKEKIIDNRVIFKETKTSPLLNEEGKQSKWNIYTKIYLHERLKEGSKPTTIINEYSNSLASKELINLGIPFSFSKPKELLQYLIKIAQIGDNSIILDFFAGSGTTGHAVMQLNAEDGGNRKFILVQLAEAIDKKSEAKKEGFNYISDITAERLRRASKKINEEMSVKASKESAKLEQKANEPSLNFNEDTTEENINPSANNTSSKPLDLGFKYFKVDTPYFPVYNYNAKTEAELKAGLKKQLLSTQTEPKLVQEELIAEAQKQTKPELLPETKAPTQQILSNRTDIEIIYEILNKYKLQLDCAVSPFTTQSSTNINLYNLNYNEDYDVIIIMKHISEAIIKEVIALKPVQIIILETTFNNDNNLKINIKTLIDTATRNEIFTVYYV